MRILYAGQLFRGSTAAHRMEALRSLGHEIDAIDTTIGSPTLFYRLMLRLGRLPDFARVNERLLGRARAGGFDVVWIDKGRTVEPGTLLEAKERNPGCALVFYAPDDMTWPRYVTRQYLASAPLYDLHVTTKSYNVEGLRAQGARRVRLVNNAYDPETHRPLDLTPEDLEKWGTEVGFVGRFEPDRGERVRAIVEAGWKVRVAGPSWGRFDGSHPNLTVVRDMVLGDDYARAICGARVNLCLLSRLVPDLQTTRSVEIPACGGFMLAERTSEHRALFEEGAEAEFFETDDEMLSKIRYYLEHEAERSAVARAGRERCLRSGYSNAETLAGVLQEARASVGR